MPPDWIDRTTLIAARAGDYLDSATLDEGGVTADTILVADALSGPGKGLQNPSFRVLALPTVTAPLDVIGTRLNDLYGAAGNDIIDSSIEACLGGDPAVGLQLLYSHGANLAQIMAVEHDGSLYVLEWVADAGSVQKATLNEILRTWQWIPGVALGLPTPAPSPVSSASIPPTPSPEPSATDGPFPNTTEATILAHVPSAIRSSCARVSTIYDHERDSVHCEPKGKPNTDYTLFATAAEMNAAYKADMTTFGNPTKSTKGCTSGRNESTYTIDKVANGRWACVVDKDKNKVIEWTDDTNLIVTYAWSPTLSWQSMYDYWFNDAGPIN